MFCFGYSTIAHPYATYRVVSKDGVMSDPVPLTLSGPVMMHDMALTENYAIFLDCPLYFNPKVRNAFSCFQYNSQIPVICIVLTISICFLSHNDFKPLSYDGCLTLYVLFVGYGDEEPVHIFFRWYKTVTFWCITQICQKWISDDLVWSHYLCHLPQW